MSYLVLTGCPVALLLNFGVGSLQWRRVFPPRRDSDHVNRQWLFVPDWLAQQLAPAAPKLH